VLIVLTLTERCSFALLMSVTPVISRIPKRGVESRGSAWTGENARLSTG
jgi:hypothetical protein